MKLNMNEWACWTANTLNVNGKEFCLGHIIITDEKPVRPLNKCLHCTQWIGNRRAIINGNLVSDQRKERMETGKS